jgi:hypothetical protein
MKIAVATTTIRVPVAMRALAACAPAVRFFVAGDRNSPHAEIEALCREIGNAEYHGPTKLSDMTSIRDLTARPYAPYFSSCRRNIALLAALKWAADVIVLWDDDNLAIDSDYFINFETLFQRWDRPDTHRPWHGLQATGPWFDPGSLTLPPVHHRGFPHAYRVRGDSPPCDVPSVLRPVTGAKVGVAAGLWLGDPDIDACDRIAGAPRVHGIAEIARAGVVVDPKQTWTVFNSQNTAFVRELAPAMMMLPGVGRHEDIWASLITQRVMRELGYVTHFGLPLVYQQRNPHDLHDDLAAETFGMRHTLDFAAWLDGLSCSGWPTASVVQILSDIYAAMRDLPWMPPQVREAGLAWCDDVEKVL